MVCSCYMDTKKLILRLKTLNEKEGIKLLDDYYKEKYAEVLKDDY